MKSKLNHYAPIMMQIPLLVRETGAKARTPDDICKLCDDMKMFAQESFQVLALDAKNNLIIRVQVSVGILYASLVHPREVFRAAIGENAAALVLVHNHPSGDPTPSVEDLRITKQLVAAGNIIGIKVLDHVIIGHVEEFKIRYLSMREDGLVDF